MNALITSRRFYAIVDALNIEDSMEDSSTGTRIIFWRNRAGKYFVALSSDKSAQMGFTTAHENAFGVVNAAIDLCK